MEDAHRFHVLAWWASGFTGIAKSGSAPNAIHFTAPPAFGGIDGRWTAEDLLLCAVASCYTTTFRALANNSKFEYTDLQVEANGTISKVESGYSFTEILVRAHLTIASSENPARAVKLLHKAEGLCLVSRTLSVKPIFETNVQIGKASGEKSHALAGPTIEGGS